MSNSRVVFDTNIFISGLFWGGSSYLVVKRAINKELVVCISPAILREIETVLKRDFNLGQQEIQDITEVISDFSLEVTPHITVDIVKDDPEDNKILACALTGHAQYIITQDNHLLKLKEFEGIKILHPQEFLEVIK